MGVMAQKVLPKPNPPSLVVDYANVLDAGAKNALEQKLVALDDSSSNQIAVVLVNSLNGEVIEDVAVNTFRNWGIGNKKTRNGVLILVAVNDKKVRIEVGYGLEGAIPDVMANDIINNDMKPAFREGNYYEGLNKATDDLSKAAVGEYKIKRDNPASRSGSTRVFLLVLIVVIIIVSFLRKGGSGGGGGGGMILPLLFFGGLGGGGNSDWGGGGDSGFGGFGGGGSGGGGASGGW